jgi:hypothetical protein
MTFSLELAEVHHRKELAAHRRPSIGGLQSGAWEGRVSEAMVSPPGRAERRAVSRPTYLGGRSRGRGGAQSGEHELAWMRFGRLVNPVEVVLALIGVRGRRGEGPSSQATERAGVEGTQ